MVIAHTVVFHLLSEPVYITVPLYPSITVIALDFVMQRLFTCEPCVPVIKVETCVPQAVIEWVVPILCRRFLAKDLIDFLYG
jgi:hypothetical protein